MKMNISVIGASGYTGAELLNILFRHPNVEVSNAFAHSSAGKRVDELYPQFRTRTDLVYEEYTVEKVKNDDLIFIALPSGEAMNIVPALISAGKRVIDLGGDFRLHDAQLYTKYYKHQHTAPDYLPKAVYGLPEWNKQNIQSAQLIANPGCYVTSALLPLLPLVREDLIETNGIIISSLSGVSGAGRSASVDLSFTETNESVKAYKAGVHQHTPEIETILNDFGKGLPGESSHRHIGSSTQQGAGKLLSGQQSTVTFVPHLIPITRGIYSTMFITPKGNISNEQIETAYKKHYSHAPFVRLIGNAVPEIKHVQYTNFCDIGWKVYARNSQIILHSGIDNLVKGAAGQAVQNMNLMLGFIETIGLV